MRHFAKLLLALCALAALPACVPTAEAAAPRGSLLYVQESSGGSVTRLGAGAFRLRLTGVSPRVSTFTDRPRRQAGSERLPHFLGRWRANGFAADPPNAALVLDRAPRSRDVALLTLSRPRYDRRHQTLTYRALPLHGEDAGALASFARRGDPVRAGEFGAASLFVDDGGGAEYSEVFLNIVNPEPGATISIGVSSAAGRAAWSLGAPGRSGFGLRVEGGVQVSALAVLERTLSLTIPGGAPGFSVSLPVEYEGTESIALTSTAGSGTTVTATLLTVEGPVTQLLGSTPVEFDALSY